MLRTLKGRVALAAAALVAFGAVLMTGLQSHQSQEAVLASLIDRHEDYTARVAAEIGDKLHLARAALSQLSANLPNGLLDEPVELERHLAALIGLRPVFHSIVIFDLKGRALAATPAIESTVQYHVADREWFRASVANGGMPSISQPLISRLSGRPVVVMSFPVHDEYGALRAIATGTLRLDQDHLLHNIGKTSIGATGYFVLVARNGTIVVHPDAGLVAEHIKRLGPSYEPIARGIAQGDGTMMAPNRFGVPSLYSFHPVPIADWVLVGIHPGDEALAELKDLSRRMIVTGIGLAVLLIPLMWLLVSRMLRPLESMRTQIRNIREGKAYDANGAAASGVTELRTVAEEFAEMMDGRRAAEAALMREKERAEVTLRSIGDAVITTDRAGNVVSMNPVAERLTGWQQSEACGRPFAEVFHALHEDTGAPIENVAARAMADNCIVSLPERTVLRAKSGLLVPIDDSAAPIHDAHGVPDGAVVVFRDVAVERATVQELNWRASHDAMTGLANRAAYEVALEGLFSAPHDAEQHAVLMMDLDEFKVVNDTSGHAAGDELLKRLARVFAARARKTDLVARLGGDEFAVIMYRCPGEQALRLAEELRRDVMGMRFVWEGRTYRVGVSIGVVAVDRSYANADEVQKAADMACYMAKRDGRHICVHSRDDRQLETMRSEMSAVSRIHSAIEDNRLRLYAQHIAPLHGERESAQHFEVLLRMVDEGGALIPPGAFLPAAERYGLMDDLDRWVIANTAEACAKRFGPDQWHLLDTVAINLSAITLRNESVVDYLIGQLEKHGVPLRCVCIEVTESAAVENLDRVRALMEGLRARGLRFALDDFGVGMTSLAQLRDLPVDILKIDGSFVANIGKDRVNGSMVYAIQNIARLLSMQTVAERVESEEELAHLTALGVNYAQGYLLARPQPIETALYAAP